MKKILFSAVSLDVGGIEKALAMLVNKLANMKDNKENYKYEVTLALERKEGIFYDELDSKINVIKYSPSKCKVIPIRKVVNCIKQRKFSRKYKNKFDFSCSFATYSRPGSFMARTASRNAVLWCHMDYLAQYSGNENKVKEFFDSVKFSEFKKLIFVSKKSRETFLQVFPEMDKNTIHINNMINYEQILNMADEKINIEKDNVSFVNVSRHNEEQKKISRIIEATKILKNKNLSFKVVLVGDGKDNKKYRKMVVDYKLEDYIKFVGNRKNPYPYIKNADCMLLTSDYEGSPVTFVEAFILNIPIITTNVAGSEQVAGKFGVVIDKDIENISNAMENFIKDGYKISAKFNAEDYNNEIIERLENIIYEKD